MLDRSGTLRWTRYALRADQTGTGHSEPNRAGTLYRTRQALRAGQDRRSVPDRRGTRHSVPNRTGTLCRTVGRPLNLPRASPRGLEGCRGGGLHSILYYYATHHVLRPPILPVPVDGEEEE